MSLMEGFSRGTVLRYWPDFLYIPGMGVLVVCALIYGFGVVVDRPLARWAVTAIENLFSGLPVVKTVYYAIKDFTEYLKPSKERKTNQVVLVRFPDTQIELIGLITRDSLHDLPAPVTKEDRVAVYFPMGYQFGGYTLFIPREWVHPTNMGVEEAMRAIITAWLPGKDKKLEGL
ncbi:MAG: DUF502 domain-containing protein [Calothrix sp. SM1_5_4]|nr:DUF502 domain-containing protein [Calothrix sp. SM1_5_4]